MMLLTQPFIPLLPRDLTISLNVTLCSLPITSFCLSKNQHCNHGVGVCFVISKMIPNSWVVANLMMSLSSTYHWCAVSNIVMVMVPSCISKWDCVEGCGINCPEMNGWNTTCWPRSFGGLLEKTCKKGLHSVAQFLQSAWERCNLETMCDWKKGSPLFWIILCHPHFNWTGTRGTDGVVPCWSHISDG